MRFPSLPVNHAAFRVIDTPEKAYSLGSCSLMAASVSPLLPGSNTG